MKEVLEHVWRESNYNSVLESKKGIDSPTAKAHRVGDSYTADA